MKRRSPLRQTCLTWTEHWLTLGVSGMASFSSGAHAGAHRRRFRQGRVEGRLHSAMRMRPFRIIRSIMGTWDSDGDACAKGSWI
jgi:hypothetical protein